MSIQPASFGVRLSTGLVLVCAVAQAGLAGVFLALGPDGQALRQVHEGLGMATPVVAVVAALLTGLATRRGGSKPLFWVALALAAATIVQVGLGQLHADLVHMTLGVAILVGAVWLVTLTRSRVR